MFHCQLPHLPKHTNRHNTISRVFTCTPLATHGRGVDNPPYTSAGA
jgi:hypothetical protein